MHPALLTLLLVPARVPQAAVVHSPPGLPQPCSQGKEVAIPYAVQLRNAGHGAESLTCLEDALTLQPEEVELLTDAGIEAHALGRLPQATAYLGHALRIDPRYPAALYGMARVQIDTSHPAAAELLLRDYLRQRPQDSSAHYGLGHALQMLQRNPEAATEFQTSIRLQPVQTESHYQLGQMALEEGRSSDAEASFATTLERLPTHGGALAGTGILRYRQHRYAEARGYLEQAVLASPDYQPAHYYLGLTLARLGQDDASRTQLEIARTLAEQQQGKGKPTGRADAAPLP